MLADVGDCGTQVPDWTAVLVTVVLHSVCWWLFASVAAAGVQLATLVGPLTMAGVGHVVVV